MPLKFKFDLEDVDWNQVAEIFRRAPLGTRKPEKLRRAAEKSYVVCFACDGDTIVGFGRALSDGEYQSAIYDVVVLPDYQHKGVGTGIMEALIKKLPGGPILVYVEPGREAFYQKLGFHMMQTGMGRFKDSDDARSRGYIV